MGRFLVGLELIKGPGDRGPAASLLIPLLLTSVVRQRAAYCDWGVTPVTTPGSSEPRLFCRVGVEGGAGIAPLRTAPAHRVCLRESSVSTFLFSRFGRAKSGLVGVGWRGVCFSPSFGFPRKQNTSPGRRCVSFIRGQPKRQEHKTNQRGMCPGLRLNPAGAPGATWTKPQTH